MTLTVQYSLLIKLTLMSAVVEETKLQLQGNGCAANPSL